MLPWLDYYVSPFCLGCPGKLSLRACPFSFRDLGLQKTGLSSAMSLSGLNLICSSLDISSSLVRALDLIWNRPGLPSHCLTWEAQSRQNLMKTRLVHRSARNVPQAIKKALKLMEDRTWQGIAGAQGHQNPSLRPRSRTTGFWGAIVGPKDLVTRPISYQVQGPRRGGRNVREQTKKVQTAKRRCRWQSCSRQIEITEGESGTPPRAVSQTVPRESTSAMRQPWEYSGRAILG